MATTVGCENIPGLLVTGDTLGCVKTRHLLRREGIVGVVTTEARFVNAAVAVAGVTIETAGDGRMLLVTFVALQIFCVGRLGRIGIIVTAQTDSGDITIEVTQTNAEGKMGVVAGHAAITGKMFVVGRYMTVGTGFDRDSVTAQAGMIKVAILAGEQSGVSATVLTDRNSNFTVAAGAVFMDQTAHVNGQQRCTQRAEDKGEEKRHPELPRNFHVHLPYQGVEKRF